ncbi:hypothetical protein [Mucilaginibacter sp.]|uniref:hypothetical protein n=1 Tax=Mucilaginibacter sp. TaxID=1882438 RepID=UPI00263671A2|nr:hypothetical protein [Mucilaginibacter sp.]MDB4920838.1 hypothetical protein [Mucilaginibacter sp.]
MKKYLLPFYVLIMLFVSCKKESNQTPDGKPKADAANNILRVDASSNISYSFSIGFVNSDLTNPTQFSNNYLTKPYEYVTMATEGQTAFIEVSSSYGGTLSCDIYYRGIKVPLSSMSVDKRDGDPITPSHINITYKVGR